MCLIIARHRHDVWISHQSICAQDTDIEEHKFGMVEQCQKLLKLDAATEEALVKQYPQPELLLPKVAPKAKGEEKAALEAKFGKKKKRKGKKA